MKSYLSLAVVAVISSMVVACGGKDSPTSPSTPTAAAVTIDAFTVTGEAQPSGAGFTYHATYNLRETTNVTGATVTSIAFALADGRSSTQTVSTRVAAGATVQSGAQAINDSSGPSLSQTLRMTIGYSDDRGNAGTATATAPVTATVRFIVDGVITNGTTGRPLANAGVGVVDASGRQISTTTDGNGYYVLRDVAAGRATMIVLASGFTTSTTTPTIASSGSINITLQEPVAPVEYRITGSARFCSATYQNQSGGTNQQTVSIPFSYKWSSARPGDFLYMSCQISQGNDSGTITVEILKNGARVASGVAVGFPNIATASTSY